MASYNKGYKREREKPWRAWTYSNGKSVFIGSFHTKEQAERAEQAAREKNKDETMPKKS